MGLERPVCEVEPRPIPAARSGKQRVACIESLCPEFIKLVFITTTAEE